MTSWEIITTLCLNVFSWMLLGFFSVSFFSIPVKTLRVMLKRGYIGFLLPLLIGRNILIHINWDDLHSLLYLALGAFIMVTVSTAISFFTAKLKKLPQPQIKTFVLMTGFHNYALMAFPIIQSLFPPKYLALLFFFTFICDALFWSLGVFILQKPSIKNIPWKEIFNPPFSAILICLPLTLFLPYDLPSWAITATHIPAMITLPFGLFCFGAILQPALKGLHWKDMTGPSMFYSYLLRSLILPILWVAVIAFFLNPGTVSKILLVEAVMPASIGTIALVTLYGGDSKLISLYCMSSNLFSAITLPIYIWILFSFKLL